MPSIHRAPSLSLSPAKIKINKCLQNVLSFDVSKLTYSFIASDALCLRYVLPAAWYPATQAASCHFCSSSSFLPVCLSKLLPSFKGPESTPSSYILLSPFYLEFQAAWGSAEMHIFASFCKPCLWGLTWVLCPWRGLFLIEEMSRAI